MKKRTKQILLFGAFMLLFVVLTLAVHLNSDKLFVLLEESGLFRDKVEQAEVTEEELGDLRSWSLDALAEDPRVVLDQSLMLVNTEYLLSEDFVPAVSEYKDTDVYMNDCMVEAYGALSAAVYEKYGKKLYVSSDFRSVEEQEQLYIEMPDTATMAGASEHQTGLALDLYVAYYAGDGFIKSRAGRFVNSECCKYGFIIRYPSFGEEVTGIRFEPWHVRYVGQPHAEVIYRNRLTLEEYILSMEIGQWYEICGYRICRQKPIDGSLTLPERFESCTVSPDNTGCMILTVK